MGRRGKGGETSADEAGKHGDDVILWIKRMEAKLHSKSKHCQPSQPSTIICRVPRDIRRVDKRAYKPMIVSIGPYHRGNSSLHDMEEVKWRNVDEFRGRDDDDLNEYWKAMKEIEPRARACYSGKIDMTEDDFIEMMLLDGLFIIELLSTQGPKKEPIHNIYAMLRRVGHDMLLLENQLPFFVLERLWNLTDHLRSFDLRESACTFILQFPLPFELERVDPNILRVIFDEEDGVHHLLHFVYSLFKPPTGSSSESMEPTAKLSAFIKKLITLPFLSPSKSPSKSKNEPPRPLKVIPSAVELDEAGVVFKCVKAERFFDVKFEQGTMKLPRLSLGHSTKSLLRNFIAYEQRFPYQGNHITNYCSVMDQLVNTPRDVEILKKSKIIENRVGSDEEAALFFNDLCKRIFLSDDSSNYLATLSKVVRKYTKKVWPEWRAKLLRDYFGSPWSIISFLAATFVVIFTGVQTYYAVFT